MGLCSDMICIFTGAAVCIGWEEPSAALWISIADGLVDKLLGFSFGSTSSREHA